MATEPGPCAAPFTCEESSGPVMALSRNTGPALAHRPCPAHRTLPRTPALLLLPSAPTNSPATEQRTGPALGMALHIIPRASPAAALFMAQTHLAKVNNGWDPQGLCYHVNDAIES